jgi:hypothetical protein
MTGGLNLLGLINFRSKMTAERWESLMAAHKELTPTDSITIVDPFLGNVKSLTIAKKFAHVTIDGQSSVPCVGLSTIVVLKSTAIPTP